MVQSIPPDRFTIAAEVANGPQQWVGYWGYGPAPHLTQQLQHLIHTAQQQSRPQIAQQSWKRYGLDLEEPTLRPLSKPITITLSAAGLSSDDNGRTQGLTQALPPDVWVQMSDTHLVLSRQGFGRVPLYWMQQEHVIWFATRLQLLLPLLHLTTSQPPPINPAALYGYSCLSYIPTPLSPIDGIMSVAAGTEERWGIAELGAKLGGVEYLSPHVPVLWQEHPDQINDEEEAIAQLQGLLTDAIKRQTEDIGDEPVGVLLSGGLDSSIVAALLVQAGINVRAYTLSLGEHGVPEFPYAEQVAQWLNIPLTTVDATSSQVQAALLPTIQALDTPFGDGVTVPLFLLHQTASQDVRIIFNGEGGDQLFAGWTNKPLIAASIYQPASQTSGTSEDTTLFDHHYLKTFHRLWGYESQVFQPKFYAAIQSIQPRDWLYPALDPMAARSLLHRLRRASLMLKGAQNIHPRATNLAFAHGLQVRSPFCDPFLTDWTFRLSGELCLQGACEKYILKRAVDGWLPPEIVWRTKRGMGVPLTPWCLREWWSHLGDWLNPGILQAEGQWQADLAARIVSGQLGGLIQGRRIGEILWLLIVWQLWRQQVLGEIAASSSWSHPFWLPYPVWNTGKKWFNPHS
ncbi:MAG: asparagine synthase [Merismopedia sp. SIO2A8]|nr:asparagine synthase [Merismopedia sp. SIO2A8]